MPPYRKSQYGWLTGNSLTAQTGRVLVIPGDLSFVMAVNGALLELTYEHNWEKFGTVTPEAAADAMRLMYFDWIESRPAVEGLQNRASLNMFWAEVIAGAAAVYSPDSAQNFGYYVLQTPAANNDRRRFWISLTPGTYEFRMLYIGVVNSGVMSGTLFRYPSGTPVTVFTNHSLYRATSQRNQILSTSFVITDAWDLWHLDLFITGAGAGGGFQAGITTIEIWRRQP